MMADSAYNRNKIGCLAPDRL